MGYECTGSGSLQLKGCDRLPQEIETNLKNYFEVCYFDMMHQAYVDLYYDGKWTDDIQPVLETAAPYIDDGSFTFTGEYGEKWRLIYHPGSQTFEEQNGYVCYSMEEAAECFHKEEYLTLPGKIREILSTNKGRPAEETLLMIEELLNQEEKE